MKKQDLLFLVIVVLLFAPFFLSDAVYSCYGEFNHAHPYIMAFIKFAILSTLGEALGLRIKKGVYNEKGFGLLPRAIVWGVLGFFIAMAMFTFKNGVPRLIESLGVEGVVDAMSGSLSWLKLLGAFGVSVVMNCTFGPVFMTFHKITDTHILRNGGKLSALAKPMPMGELFSMIDWKVQWGFVFKKTIPFFWFPAHTITFLLPANVQVLFAALLGIALGVLLSVAAVMSREKK